MKIAMLGHKRIPGREGGIEVVVEELATRMASKGNSVTVYNRAKKGHKVLKEYKGVHIITIPTIQTKKLDAIIYSFLASIHVSFTKADIVHYHAIGPASMLWIPHIFRKTTVVTIHGLNYKTPKWKGFGEKYIRWSEKVISKYADAIITLSKEQQKYFREKYNRETFYIPNGTTVTVPKKVDIINQKWGLNKDSYILFLSRVVPGKGLETLIQAYKNVNTDLKLVVAGGSEYLSDFRSYVQQLASDDKRIVFVGFVDGDALVELYSNAYLFVFPSEAEGMPMCLLEALSFNTPCLVSDIPENIEVGKNYVQKFKTGNVHDLSLEIQKCIEKRQQLFNKNSRLYIETEFNWDSIVDKTIGVYNEIGRNRHNFNAEL